VSGANWVRLDWDSDHFGVGVARLGVPADDLPQARAALADACRAGIALVYGMVEAPREAPAELLAEFHGRLVDRKTTFGRPLAGADSTMGGGAPAVVEYPPGPASPELRSLAVLAGMHSRFRVDPRVPGDRFEALYTTWMERSTRRHLADVVLVAVEDGRAGPLGMVTVSAKAGTGAIGLIAVAEQAQGRGVGRRLLRAAHAWMVGHGLRTARVVTQGTNAAACRLYESCGYTPVEVVHYYHFWPRREPANHS
jgi:dTDP-4-amino-4,6-dideoxy-D-galactose acyltransferase